MPVKSAAYDQDFFAWANEQAALLRAGKTAQADLEHIAEEIETMGKTEKRELVSRLTVLLLHLLKWQFQPSMRGNSWRVSIANTRDELEDHLDDNPSLRAGMTDYVATAYRRARRQAAVETGLPEVSFPAACGWTDAQIFGADFWPE